MNTRGGFVEIRPKSVRAGSPNGPVSLMVVVAALTFLALLAGPRRELRRLTSRVRITHEHPSSTARLQWSDRFGDGTPDFLRLTDPADQAAFRRWFTAIAEFQALRRRAEVPAEIMDCASLLRYSYREALKRHDGQWFAATGMEVAAPPGEIRAWHYPDTPLGLGLFKITPGPFETSGAADGAFAQFADAKTLVERNAYMVSRDVRAALPGDLLFWRQFGHSSPWHSMIVLAGSEVVYDTGPDHGRPGELRRVRIEELFEHPDARWRPVVGNPNFLGVYRWNILRGGE